MSDARVIRKKKRKSLTRRLHRTIGASAALFVLIIVLSGLALNHSDDFGLSETHVTSSFLSQWYGLGGDGDIRSYPAGDHWLSIAGTQLYFDDRPVASLVDAVGAVSGGEILLAAGGSELILLDRQGRLIEKMAWEHPGPIVSVGRLPDGTPALGTASGTWVADEQFLHWRPAIADGADPAWSVATPAPAEITEAVSGQYRGRGLSLERLLLDLHSGRIFGSFGRLFFDAVAVAIGFLAVSGLIVWFRGRKNGNARRSRD